MKNIIICIFLLLNTAIMAQSIMTNTTTITVDKKVNGKIVQEVFVIEGDGADKKLKELKEDQSVVNIDVEKRVEMRSDDFDAEEVKKRIEVEIEDLEKVTGKTAERSEEIVEIEITTEDQKEIKKYKVKIIENGKEEVIEWNGEGEMPEKMKKVMVEHETIIDVKDNESNEVHKYKMSKDNGLKNMVINTEDYEVITEENTNPGQIGVMVSGGDEGVKILSFTEDSMAKAAGLEIGDIITGVNGSPVITMGNLVDGLSNFMPGDIVSIDYTRGGRKLSKEVTLSKRH